VLKNGHVKLYDRNKASALAFGSTLKFKTVMVVIDPLEISEGATLYIRKPYSQSIPIVKKSKLYFIRATVNYVYWNNLLGKEMYFHFLPM
jgi:hypothetical protein